MQPVSERRLETAPAIPVSRLLEEPQHYVGQERKSSAPPELHNGWR